MARRYNRDSRGRFASGGGGGGSRRPAPRGISRGTNRLTRDNSGRITSVGGDGATARGGRLRTASGKQRATQTARISGGRAAGTTAKPRGLKPESSRKLKTGVAVNRMRSINERMGNRPDIAEQNIRGRFRGQAGKRFDARIDRAVKEVKRAERERTMKPKAQVKAERAARAKAKVRADKLRKVHENTIVSNFAAKHNKPKSEVRAAIRSMDPEKQVRLFRQHVKENRATVKPATRKAAAAAKPVRRGLTGKGKAPSTRLPSANSDQYKYNKAGLIATPQERSRMRGRDRAREKNAALAQQQAAGRLRAERRAARRMTSASAEPGSVSRYSSTFNAAERALRRRSQRADSNFRDSVKLEQSKAQLTAKAVKMQNQAAQRKAEGKPITKTMESNFQKLRRDIAKIDRSLQTRRRALEVTSSASQRMEINTRNRR